MLGSNISQWNVAKLLHCFHLLVVFPIMYPYDNNAPYSRESLIHHSRQLFPIHTMSSSLVCSLKTLLAVDINIDTLTGLWLRTTCMQPDIKWGLMSFVFFPSTWLKVYPICATVALLLACTLWKDFLTAQCLASRWFFSP